MGEAHYELYEHYNPTTNTLSDKVAMDDLITDFNGYTSRNRICINTKSYIDSNRADNNYTGYKDSNGNDIGEMHTLYLKEITASQGYALDTGVYQLDLEKNDENDGRYWHVKSVTYYKDGKAQAGTYLKDGVVQVKEDPQNDPINVLIKKNSANGEKVSGSDVEKQSQGAATYKDAEFTVYYYDTTDATTLSKDHDTRVKAATRTWVFKTDKDGWIKTDTDVVMNYYSAADSPSELYYTTNEKGEKRYTFPVGTYVIEETDAPAGFTAPDYNKRTFIEVVRPEDNPSGDEIETYHEEYYHPDDLKWNAWYLKGETKK